MCGQSSVLSAQVEEDIGDISSKLTLNFTPSYEEFHSSDTTRPSSITFSSFVGKKLIFHDNFQDNRHVWSHWKTTGDSILRHCVGLDQNYICRGRKGDLVDAYTNMVDGKKVLFAFTPDEKIRYSKNFKITKNYVVTLNPLSIKQVERLPTAYYEGFAEHTTRIHNELNLKNFVIETRIESAVGSWGLLFGNTFGEKPYYHFQVNPDSTWKLYAIYYQDRSNLVELQSGKLPVAFQHARKLSVEFQPNSSGGFKLLFQVNDQFAGSASVTRMPLYHMDIGYRLDHNSIDGNNVLIANSLSVYEVPIKTYFDDGLNIAGKWHGVLNKNGQKVFDASIEFFQREDGEISGRLFLEHARFSDIKITKRLKGRISGNVVNFEELSGSSRGVTNKVQLHSLLLKGHMELLNPDSIRMEAYLASNLDQYGEFDPNYSVFSNEIHLGRKEKTQLVNPSFNDKLAGTERSFTIENIYFLPDLPNIDENDKTKQSLDYLARSLQREIASYPNTLIIIHGHTDIGALQLLSIGRALAIRSELLKRGVPNQVLCIGNGRSRRLVGIRGDQRNRRAELELIKADSFEFDHEDMILKEGAKLILLRDLPGEYVIHTDFKLDPEGEYFVLFKMNSQAKPMRWKIPNTEGNARQALRITRKYNAKEDAILLEFWLNGINVLTQSIHAYEQFGFEVKSGTFRLFNINIFAPE